MRRSTVLKLGLLFTLLLPATLLAQGTLSGTVADIGGDPLPGVSILVQGTGSFATTDGAGKYTIDGVPAGTFVVEAILSGFKPATQEASITDGGSATADFTLELDLLNLDSIVVTGTLNPQSKIESSTAITSKDSEEIREQAPLNTAQLLEVIPGFWAESSGGEGGNNVFARGIPQDGSFRYIAMHEDGLPVYESPELAFTNIDLLMRVDETVEVMEAVRGGSSSVFASNAPGGIINFVTKTGGEVPEGLIKLTVGDYDLFRTDLTYGGPLGEDWRFNVGGFYRFDNGIRDPEFPANRGGQFRLNLTRFLDNGFIRFNAKLMEERNIFYLPIPLQNPGSPDGVPGFDPNFGTMTSNDAAIFTIPSPDGGSISRNLKDGMHPQVLQIGGEINLEYGNGWSIQDRFRFMDADIGFEAIFSLDNPFDATLYAEGRAAEVGASSFRYRYTNFPDVGFNPANANGNGLVAQTGWWTVDKPLDNFMNDFRITKSFDGITGFEGNNFTAGFYFSDYSANEFWVFNTILQEVRDAGRLLDLDLLDSGGNVIVSATDNGAVSYGDLYVNASHNGFLWALYLNDEIQVNEKLRLDLGLRYERAEFDGSTENREIFDLGDSGHLADDTVEWGTGLFTPYSYDFDETAWSLGLNYNFKPGMAFYARVSDAFRMPDFEQWTFNPREKGDVEDVFQVEGGIKVSTPEVGIFASVFLSQFDNVRFEDEQIDPATGDLTRFVRFADTETIGLEAEIIWAPNQNWQLSFTTTIQQPEFKNYLFNVFNPDTGMLEQRDFSGNQVRRIPEMIFNFRPSYRKGAFKVYGSFFYGDERFVSDDNTSILPDYTKIDAGIQYSFPKITLQLHGSNLTNEIGLTEGNPRVGQIIGVQQDIYMARPILGRSWRLSAIYKF